MEKNNLEKRVKKEIEEARNTEDLARIRKKYLGKQGELSQILGSLKDLPERQRAETGRLVNRLKQGLEKIIEEKRKELPVRSPDLQKKKIDITRPGEKIEKGHLHPLTLVWRRAEEIFQLMGFSVVEGPEVENEWYNFDALNIPEDHPARDMWDTFWLKTGRQKVKAKRSRSIENKKLLLRAHTSPVQVRYMEKNNPPLRIIVPGKIFRHEATDASHEFQFYHLEGLMVGKNISVAHFKAILQEFFKIFFEKPLKIRLRPSYFPFTEPSFEIDVNCVVCQGKGCSVCKESGWLEMMGAGMVHPNVLKNSGLNPQGLTGFAFGMGLDRLAMMKYRIDDIRLFHSGDLRFLEQF